LDRSHHHYNLSGLRDHVRVRPTKSQSLMQLRDGAIVFREAYRLGCEGIVSKRLGSIYRRGRSPLWLKVKNPAAPAVKCEAEEDWGRKVR
jgi:ATP-dependent DNA ligase